MEETAALLGSAGVYSLLLTAQHVPRSHEESVGARLAHF